MEEINNNIILDLTNQVNERIKNVRDEIDLSIQNLLETEKGIKENDTASLLKRCTINYFTLESHTINTLMVDSKPFCQFIFPYVEYDFKTNSHWIKWQLPTLL